MFGIQLAALFQTFGIHAACVAGSAVAAAVSPDNSGFYGL
jgi:hypothetical protein